MDLGSAPIKPAPRGPPEQSTRHPNSAATYDNPGKLHVFLIDGARWQHPLVDLTGDGADVFEIDVVVQHRKIQ